MTVIILTIYIDAKVVHSRGTTKKTDKKMESVLPPSVGNTLSIPIYYSVCGYSINFLAARNW